MAMEPRRYESLIRTAQADATRRRIAAAARELFVEHGWAKTTIRQVAQRAEVSVPTVYSAYGNKKGLALALVDAMDLAADPDRGAAELAEAQGDPARQLAVAVGFDRRLCEHSGDLMLLLREAARTEPELAEAHRLGPRRGMAALSRVFGDWPAGTLRDGYDPGRAVAVYTAIVTVDAYLGLVERGWRPEEIEGLWLGLLTRELLAD